MFDGNLCYGTPSLPIQNDAIPLLLLLFTLDKSHLLLLFLLLTLNMYFFFFARLDYFISESFLD